MTGTADTEATEFQQIYNLEVIVIPPHKKMIRKDHVDLIYLTAKEKYLAIIGEIKRVHETSQPILVGTTSIETSEYISSILKKEKIKHSVLNAKHHQMEAEIISNAGGKITGCMVALDREESVGGELARDLIEKRTSSKLLSIARISQLVDFLNQTDKTEEAQLIEDYLSRQ